MEKLYQIQSMAGLDSPGSVGITFFTFMGVFFLILGYLDVVRRRNDIRRRTSLDRGMAFAGPMPVEEGWQNSTRSLRYRSLSATSALLGDVERRANEKETEGSKIRRELLRAGFFGENSVVWYQSIRLCLTVGFILLGLIVIEALVPHWMFGTKVVIVAGLAALGFMLPSQYVATRRGQIVQECRDGFPDFIDLMVICAESGLSPRAAIDRLSREIAATYPYLGANLYLINLEIRAGSTIHEALFNLAKRTEVEEASALASLLQQTEQLGTSIGDALRVYSEEMRERRLIRAEERAHALPVKLVIPLGVYVFPVVLIVILLPVVIRMRNALL